MSYYKVSKKDINYIHRACEESRKSDMLMKHGCVIVSGNKIIGKGTNNYRTQFKNNFIQNKVCSCHAEMDALNNMMKTMKHSHKEIGRKSLFQNQIKVANPHKQR